LAKAALPCLPSNTLAHKAASAAANIDPSPSASAEGGEASSVAAAVGGGGGAAQGSVKVGTARSAVTLLLLAAITGVAITLKDIATIVGISGALLGAGIVYVIPALVYSKAMGPGSASWGVYALYPLGAFLGILGTFMTLKGA
jgi:hypothetical protein